MILYTINNVYPDKNFVFTIDAVNMGFAPLSHNHAMDDISAIGQALAAKADNNHTHVCVSSLFCTTVTEGETSVSLSVQAVSGSNSATCTATNQQIVLNYDSPETGDVLGITEVNPKADKILVQMFIGKMVRIDDDNNNAVFLSMEDNTNA